MTIETDAEKIVRLEAELQASSRNNYLLQAASAKVVSNNEVLRRANKLLLEQLQADDLDAAAMIGILYDAQKRAGA